MRFRLRTLFWLVSAVAVVFGLFAGEEKWVQPSLFLLLSFWILVGVIAAVFGYRSAADIALARLVVVAVLFRVILISNT